MQRWFPVVAAALLAVALTCGVPAQAGAAVTPAQVVYYPGVTYTPAQFAVLSPEEIGVAGHAIAAHVRFVAGARSNEPQPRPASPAHLTAARAYALANVNAMQQALMAVRDRPVPEVTPDNINSPTLVREIRDTAAFNALNDDRRQAIIFAMARVREPVGTHRLFQWIDP